MIATTTGMFMGHPVTPDDPIAGTTMPWLRLTRQDSEAERALHRGVAAQVPFLLAPDLSEADWAFRRLWDLRPATDFATALGGTQLVDLARRLGRVLVSRDPSLLDDERYPPGNSPGIIVVGKTWEKHLDEFLVTIAGLLGPIVALYRHVKVHGEDSGNLTITSPEGRHRRVTRRFLVDAEGLPLLSGLSEAGQSMGATR